jgi:hypothetical protein
MTNMPPEIPDDIPGDAGDITAPAPEFKETVEKSIREYHEHLRHIFGLFITWFTFFIGVNYVGIGWFASAADKSTAKPTSIGLIALLFIVQCALGIAVCATLLWHFRRTCKRIEFLQKKDKWTDKVLEGRTTMPLFVYQFSVSGGMAAIITVGIAWIGLWVLRGSFPTLY